MSFNTEFWRICAGGLFDVDSANSLLAILKAETDNNKRRVGIEDGSLVGHFQWIVRQNSAFNYFVDKNAISIALTYISNMFEDSISVREDIPPKPKGLGANDAIVVTSGEIEVVDPGEDYETKLFSWNFVKFEEVGTFATGLNTISPGSGIYVAVTYKKESENDYSIPSTFITVP